MSDYDKRKKGSREEMMEYLLEKSHHVQEADIERRFLNGEIGSSEYVKRKETLKRNLEILTKHM